MGFRTAGLTLLALAALTGAAGADCSPDQVELRTLFGAVQRFSVDLADDPDERARGLMFRDQMPMASGMLFIFPAPKHATFWMKNTPLSLDIIFADATGLVTFVQDRAEPLSEALIDGGEGVAFVLEINGGLARPMGIVPGAVLRHPSIAQDRAAWACDAP